MSWNQFRIELGQLDPEQLEDALFTAGALSITMSDAKDTPVLEPAPGETPLWPSTRFTALFAEDCAVQSIVRSLQASLDTPLPAYSLEPLADRVWEREWMKDFHPMNFGHGLWVCPHEQRVPEENATVVYLDPGLAFGTGTHETTALCLEWLGAAELAGRQVMDYGCGSGILAVAALKLGAAAVHCVDIDPQALEASLENARKNAVDQQLAFPDPDQLPPQGYDIVLANILAGPLASLAGR
ncbi:MAG: 50S ribosomal protein L11 methyltransferase, partial [Gammaproteobacteria bacterium]|nr:50S ribosomal protein L11 methyltransferase [Gammaproteobacteria bacterium]